MKEPEIQPRCMQCYVVIRYDGSLRNSERDIFRYAFLLKIACAYRKEGRGHIAVTMTELRAVKDRFHLAERRGWFLSDTTSVKYPLTTSGVSLEGRHGHQTQDNNEFRRAAVLFIIGHNKHHDQLKVMITKRSTTVGTHAGMYYSN